MFVRDRMSKNVATVKPDASVSKAFQVLTEKGHSQLPVIDDNGKLVGLLTEKLLSEVSPSKATSLSVYEINYLLSKTKVSDIMKKEVFTTYPDNIIEEAAWIMKKEDIGSLPVVLEDKTLVGIVTRLDIFGAFIDIMGVKEPGTRITLEVKDEMGTLADISSIIKKYGVSITHVSNFDVGDRVELVIKLSSFDVDGVINELEEKQYTVLSVIKNHEARKEEDA